MCVTAHKKKWKLNPIFAMYTLLSQDYIILSTKNKIYEEQNLLQQNHVAIFDIQ